MTKKAYFTDHLPHRVNLLITFRERYRPGALSAVNPEHSRDFHRCSKDIAMLMVRFFFGEMGVTLPEGALTFAERKSGTQFKIQRMRIADITNDRRNASIFQIMKSANRAVAHLNPDYACVFIHTDEMVFDAIDFTEEMIRAKIYHSASGYDLDKVMALSNNAMHRKRLVPHKE